MGWWTSIFLSSAVDLFPAVLRQKKRLLFMHAGQCCGIMKAALRFKSADLLRMHTTANYS